MVQLKNDGGRVLRMFEEKGVVYSGAAIMCVQPVTRHHDSRLPWTHKEPLEVVDHTNANLQALLY